MCVFSDIIKWSYQIKHLDYTDNGHLTMIHTRKEKKRLVCLCPQRGNHVAQGIIEIHLYSWLINYLRKYIGEWSTKWVYMSETFGTEY